MHQLHQTKGHSSLAHVKLQHVTVKGCVVQEDQAIARCDFPSFGHPHEVRTAHFLFYVGQVPASVDLVSVSRSGNGHAGVVRVEADLAVVDEGCLAFVEVGLSALLDRNATWIAMICPFSRTEYCPTPI